MRKKPTTKSGKKAKMAKVMGEAKAGKLKSAGKKVTNPKQALAIGLKESGQSKPAKTAAGRKKKLENVSF